MTEPDQNYGNF